MKMDYLISMVGSIVDELDSHSNTAGSTQSIIGSTNSITCI